MSKATDQFTTPAAAGAVSATAHPDTPIMEIGRLIVAAENRRASYDIGGSLYDTVAEATAELRLNRAVQETSDLHKTACSLPARSLPDVAVQLIAAYCFAEGLERSCENGGVSDRLDAVLKAIASALRVVAHHAGDIEPFSYQPAAEIVRLQWQGELPPVFNTADADDAELLGACQDASGLIREYRAFYEGPCAIKDDMPVDAAIDAIGYSKLRGDIFKHIAAIPARTLAGLQAKARVIVADQCDYRFTGEELTASLLEDLAGSYDPVAIAQGSRAA